MQIQKRGEYIHYFNIPEGNIRREEGVKWHAYLRRPWRPSSISCASQLFDVLGYGEEGWRTGTTHQWTAPELCASDLVSVIRHHHGRQPSTSSPWSACVVHRRATREHLGQPRIQDRTIHRQGQHPVAGPGTSDDMDSRTAHVRVNVRCKTESYMRR